MFISICPPTHIYIYMYICLNIYMSMYKQSHCFGLYIHTIKGKQWSLIITSINQKWFKRRTNMRKAWACNKILTTQLFGCTLETCGFVSMQTIVRNSIWSAMLMCMLWKFCSSFINLVIYQVILNSAKVNNLQPEEWKIICALIAEQHSLSANTMALLSLIRSLVTNIYWCLKEFSVNRFQDMNQSGIRIFNCLSDS